MIIEIRIRNMFSIRDEMVLDMTSGGSKSKNATLLASNVFNCAGYDLLKSVVIYGANASGKSNLIKAVRFCCMMVLNSHNHNENAVFNFIPFKFESYDNKPSAFFIKFIYDGVEYEYAYSFTRQAVLTESLFFYPRGRRTKVFTRDETKGKDKRNVYSFSKVIKRPMDVAINTSDKTLFVSRASQMDREVAKDVFRFFSTSLKFSPIMRVGDIENLFNTYKDSILSALQIADSDIVDVNMRREKRHSRQIMLQESLAGDTIPVRDIEEEVLKFTTFHRANPNIPFDIDTEESKGTKQLFMNMLQIIDVLKNGRALFWDEIDSSLHSKIVDYLFKLFNSGNMAQLVSTAHDTNLLGGGKLRKDQIYFMNKSKDGASDLYSLFDYKDFRDTMDVEKAYLQGRFDAIPYINDSETEIKTLLGHEE